MEEVRRESWSNAHSSRAVQPSLFIYSMYSWYLLRSLFIAYEFGIGTISYGFLIYDSLFGLTLSLLRLTLNSKQFMDSSQETEPESDISL